jgi:hypothetical protein
MSVLVSSCYNRLDQDRSGYMVRSGHIRLGQIM